jgi:hypothetical protein
MRKSEAGAVLSEDGAFGRITLSQSHHLLAGGGVEVPRTRAVRLQIYISSFFPIGCTVGDLLCQQKPSLYHIQRTWKWKQLHALEENRKVP